MKLLLDEQLPHELRRHIDGHEVVTVAYAGLSGFKNGELLRAAAERGFVALVTNDRGMEHQQNQATLPIAIVALRTQANKIEAILPFVSALMRTLAALRPRTFVRVSGDD